MLKGIPQTVSDSSEVVKIGRIGCHKGRIQFAVLDSGQICGKLSHQCRGGESKQKGDPTAAVIQ